ncbi:unnamed protein product [Caenorhabditis brenneri]
MPREVSSEELNKHEFANLNYGYVDWYEWSQFLSRLLSHALCIWLHVIIVTRILVANKFRVKSDYQILIIAQSVINIIACFFELILNEVQTQQINDLKIGHPFWHFSMNERVFYIIAMNTASTSSQDILLVFNLHRLFIIKKKSLVLLYAIAVPLMLAFPIMDAYNSYPIILAGRFIDLFVKHSQIPIIAAVTIICYFKLKKEFATNPCFSERTKRLQQKLSWSILMQLGLLCIILLLITIIPLLCINFVEPTFFLKYAVYYVISAVVFAQWYSFCSAALIAWSITGFFKSQSPSVTVTDSSVRTSSVVARKHTAKPSLM